MPDMEHKPLWDTYLWEQKLARDAGALVFR